MDPTELVYVVDDDDGLRSALGILLEDSGLSVRLCASADEFLDVYEPRDRNCLLLDLRMPKISGVELQRIMKEKGIDIPTIILTGHGDVPLAVQTIKAGARDFIEKPFDEQFLLDTVSRVLSEDSHKSSDDINPALLLKLTKRENEIAFLIYEGKKNKEIANSLDISIRTVENHRAKIMKKLEIRTSSQLVRLFSAGNMLN
jgi:RNA polymerase sigma factor (sigma-70 family)